MTHTRTTLLSTTLWKIVFGLLILGSAFVAEAASLSLSPNTAVREANSTFSVSVLVDTDGESINAAEGSLRFNPRELSVVNISRGSSIFNLWVADPSYSNSAGTISFSGGSPGGYSGSRGNIMTITFRTVGTGGARVSFTDGSVLANDGRGSNVLTNMSGGTYTIQAQSTDPEPEEIEYVAPANTPSAPTITSATHDDPDAWHQSETAELSWTLPADITGVRTLLNENPTSVPTNVYDDPISSITLEDLPQGVSYFHLQFRNSDGWGRVTHYRLAVDSVAPESITIDQATTTNEANPVQTLSLAVTDQTSAVSRLRVKVDDAEPFEAELNASGTLALPSLEPGYHSVIIEAFDAAGNSIVGSYTFTIAAFEKPVFTEYPSQINEEVIPVITGATRPNATVDVFLHRVGSEVTTYTVMSDEAGSFTFIPESTLSTGVYELSAQATDEFGAQSEVSNVVRIAVQQPGYLRIGNLIISVLSVIVPLVGLVLALVLGSLYLYSYLRRFRRKVGVESREAMEILHREFSSLQSTLREQESALQSSRKSKKLTKAESEMVETFDRALQESQRTVEKEIADVTVLAKKSNDK